MGWISPSMLASVASGLAGHLYCHLFPSTTLSGFFMVILAPPAILTYGPPNGVNQRSLVLNLTVYLLALCSSIVAYRLSPFHPLARFPGPLLARVSRFWALKQCLGRKQHVVSHELFARYGDVVRSGPNHLLFRDARAIPVILGARNPWMKHQNATIGIKQGVTPALLFIMNSADHGKRRRIWDRAFTPSALKSYEPMMQAHVDELNTRLSERHGQEIDLAAWLAYLSLDVMGDFAFGGVFNFLDRGEDPEGFSKLGEKFLGLVEALGTIPWINVLLQALPEPPFPLHIMAEKLLQKRKVTPPKTKDLLYHLLDESGEDGSAPARLSDQTLVHEVSLAVVAGSDTTATALANAMFHLIADPTRYARLREEVDASVSKSGGEIELTALTELPYLNAVINETLRLHPAVPNGSQRTLPADGGPIDVAGHIVPVGTVCQIPTWSLHRDPRNFSPEPQSFLPERWLPEGMDLAQSLGQEFRLSKAAFNTFNYGPNACIGRTLALQELRLALTGLVHRFDFQFTPNFVQDDWLGSLKDHFVLTRGVLPVIVRCR